MIKHEMQSGDGPTLPALQRTKSCTARTFPTLKIDYDCRSRALCPHPPPAQKTTCLPFKRFQVRKLVNCTTDRISYNRGDDKGHVHPAAADSERRQVVALWLQKDYS